MALIPQVTRRKGSAKYYARIGIPTELQAHYGKKEIWRSLRTTDASVARRLARPFIERWEIEFEQLRQRRTLTERDLQEAVWDRYAELIQADERFRQTLPTDADLDIIWKALEEEFEPYDLPAYRILEYVQDRFAENQRERHQRMERLRGHAARGETMLVDQVVRLDVDKRRLDVPRDSAEYRRLANGFQRAELEALSRAQERDAGDWGGEPRDKLVRPPHAMGSPTVAPPGETILQLYDRFKRERHASASADTWEQNRKIVVRFSEFVGLSAHVTAVNRMNVRGWKQQLEKWPVKASEIAAFRGLAFKEVIAANDTLQKSVIVPKTINKYLAALGAFSSWLQANDYIAEDAMKGMYLSVDKAEKTRLPFGPDQLVGIFNSPLFMGFRADGKEHEPGPMQTRDWRFWIPLIALFTGARLGEIAQCLLRDVRKLHGRWIIHITEEGSALKSTKTKGSMRVIPIHAELIRIGFPVYHAEMSKRGIEQLFPEIKPDARGFFSGRPSGFFNDYLTRVGVKKGKPHNFHSFRHGMADALRRAGYRDEEFAYLLGHTKATTTGRYGTVPEGMLFQRAAMIDRVAYEGLDLSHLYRG